VHVYTCVYVRVCVRCVLVHVYVCARIRTCVFACVCACWFVFACAYVVRACACEGIEGALPLGALPPQERVSLPSYLSPLGALRGGLGCFPSLSPFMLRIN